MKSVRTSLWFLWLLIFSLLLFLRGFLLTKKEVEKFSSCLDYPHTHCWSTPRYKRAVLLLIDALRHDFTVFNDTLINPEPWQNKMTVFSNLRKQFPDRTKHIEFIADPPSATFLRLKGLTTGGLPTFVDLGSNFGASEITEDSWVKQLSLNDKKLILIGDDTWMNIYSQYFHRSFPYPSFDVWDLHTVDNGVWEHLLPQMRTSDWDVIVAHFLGVDHAGHRYHVKHPELSEKLVQMNSWVEEVVRNVEEDTVLFVFGDHGMTSSGDHGGETQDEVTSTLFIYSGSKFGDMVEEEKELFDKDRVFQTDLVPTLTLLLGVPVPYSSLGSVIPFLFLSGDADSRVHLQHVINTNMNQVFRYIITYSMISSEFSAADISDIKSQVDDINLQFQSNQSIYSLDLVRDMLKVIRTIRDLCSAHWAQFNLPLMAFALLIMVMLSLVLLLTQSVSVHWWVSIPVVPFVIISFDRLSLWSGATHAITVLLTLSSVVLTFYKPVQLKLISVFDTSQRILPRILSINGFINSNNCTEITGTALILIMSVGFTTNSYILVEDYITIFFSGTLLLVNYVSLHSFTLHREHALQTLTALLSSRLSATFFGCREEQFWCTRTWWVGADDVSEVVRSRRYFVSVCVFVSMMYGLYWYQKHQGCLVSGMLRIVHCFVHPVQCTLVVVYWALSTSPTKLFTDSQLCLLPRCVYLLTLLSVSLILYSPSTVHVQTTRHSTPRLFGGVFCYSAPSLTAYASMLPTCALLLTQTLSPTLALLTVHLLCLSRLLQGRSVAVKLIACHVITVQYFYATGHQAAVQQFDWNAAFVGFASHPNHVIPVLLIVLRTLMSSVLVTLFLPTILLYSPVPTTKQVDIQSELRTHPEQWCGAEQKTGVGNTVKNEVDNTEQLGTVLHNTAHSGTVPQNNTPPVKDASPNTAQLQFYTDPSLLPGLFHTTLRLSTSLLLLKCLWCCTACYIHRRHLMIWNIFTPRMITEVCLSVSTSVCLVGVSVLLSRTHWCVGEYLDRTLKSN